MILATNDFIVVPGQQKPIVSDTGAMNCTRGGDLSVFESDDKINSLQNKSLVLRLLGVI